MHIIRLMKQTFTGARYNVLKKVIHGSAMESQWIGSGVHEVNMMHAGDL